MDLGKLLRASDDRSFADKFTIYLPDRDMANRPVRNFGTWVDSAVDMMMDINGGCTRLAPAKGGWYEDGEYVMEDTVIIYSYLFKPAEFKTRFNEIVEFIHRFGRETDQHTMMAEFSSFLDGSYMSESYKIPKANYLPALPQRAGS
jgi:hypothetical protein